MADDKKELSPRDLANALYEFAYCDADESSTLSLKDVENDLKAEGIDPKKSVASIQLRIQKAIGKRRMALAKAERTTFLERTEESMKGLSQSASRAFQDLLSVNPNMAHAFARKFEDAADEQTKQEIVQDLILAQERERSHGAEG